MNFLMIVRKNFTILARSRSGAFMLLLGPLIVVALVALFLGGRSQYELSVGYYAPGDNNFSVEFVSALRSSDFLLTRFESEEACVEKIKKSSVHTCIIFPEDFQLDNRKSAELRFVVDYSRINLVYKIIDEVSGIIDNETDEMSRNLTFILLDEINKTFVSIEENKIALEEISSKSQILQDQIEDAGNKLSEMSFDMKDASLVYVYKNFNSTNASVEMLVADISLFMEFSMDLYEEIRPFVNSNESDRLFAKIEKLNVSASKNINYSSQKRNLLYEDLIELEEELISVVENSKVNEEISRQIKDKINVVINKSHDLREELYSTVTSLSSVQDRISNIKIKRAETIVNPVNAKIEPVINDVNNLQSTAPYLLAMMLMFISLMISGTLVVFEKNSKAVFRNYMAPVNEKTFVLSTFFTVVTIVLVQSALILFASQLFLGQNLLSRPVEVFVVILSCIVFFSILGMLIGSILSTQDAVMMACLVFGSVFLFLSNLVLPIESIAPSVAGLVKLNPYVVFSELLRGPMMFSVLPSDFVLQIGVLTWISISILACMLTWKGFFSKKPKISIWKK